MINRKFLIWCFIPKFILSIKPHDHINSNFPIVSLTGLICASTLSMFSFMVGHSRKVNLLNKCLLAGSQCLRRASSREALAQMDLNVWLSVCPVSVAVFTLDFYSFVITFNNAPNKWSLALLLPIISKKKKRK